MNNKAVNYAGQPYMLYIWEYMWRGIANRLDDKEEAAFDNGLIWTDEMERKRKAATYHWEVLDGMLDEAEQLRDNVRRIKDPMKWKFSLVNKPK